MKLRFLTILSITLFIFSCTTPEKSVDKDNCYPNNNRPKQAITYEEMADMMESYDKGAKKVLDKYTKKESGGKDTVSTVYNWYNIEDLKQYIAYVEKISKEKNIELTGFRIYPTSYPKNYKDKDLRGRQTIIFTPTALIDGKKDEAFEPLYSDNGKPAKISQFLEQVRAKQVQTGSVLPLKLQDGTPSSSANRLKPSPPY